MNTKEIELAKQGWPVEAHVSSNSGLKWEACHFVGLAKSGCPVIQLFHSGMPLVVDWEDLRLAKKKIKKWVNVFNAAGIKYAGAKMYDNYEEALNSGMLSRIPFIVTTIEWEEDGK